MSSGGEVDRFELLAAVGDVADGSLSLEETVQRLLDIVVPGFADAATLDAVTTGGDVRHLGARVSGADREELELALLRRRPLVEADAGAARTLSTGRGYLIAPLTDVHLRALAASQADYERLVALGLRTVVFLPLRARGRTVGTLVCGVGPSQRLYGAEDTRFAEVLGGRIALALDNAGLSETVSELERQLEATLANLTEAVVVREPQGRMVFANPAAARLLGVSTVPELMTASAEVLMGRFEAYDESGRPLDLDDLPSARALRGEPAAPMLVRNLVRATGKERWLLHKATPVFDDEGQLSLVINVIEDVTEAKRTELSQRLLAEAGKALASSLDYEQTLQRVAQLAVPELADWCGVTIRGEGDFLHQVAVAHVDPERIALAAEYSQRYPPRLSDPTGAAEVIRSGESQLVPEITEEMLAQAPLAPEQLDLLRRLEMHSVIIVALTVPGRPPIGALTLVMAESARRFDAHDLTVAEELGRSAGAAVENARLYTERSGIATTLQRSLLPPELPHIPGFRLASLYRPAGGRSEVGGDFYDAFAVPGGWMVVVGDVVGRGAEAAALTSLSRYTLRAVGRLLGDPVAALRELNAALRERPGLPVVTVCCALLRETDGEAEADIVLAGHPPAFHVRDGEPEMAGHYAPLLGAYDGDGWEAETVPLSPGDHLVLYTDGITDTIGRGERFGEERLAGTLRDVSGAAAAVRRIEEAVRAFARGPQTDDSAVLVIERHPAMAGAAAARGASTAEFAAEGTLGGGLGLPPDSTLGGDLGLAPESPLSPPEAWSSPPRR